MAVEEDTGSEEHPGLDGELLALVAAEVHLGDLQRMVAADPLQHVLGAVA